MGGYSRKKLDLTGQQFGKLTVLSPAENVGGRTAWLCQCSCGKQIVIKTCHLRAGHTRSCGCLTPKDSQSALGLTYIDGTCVEMLRAKTVRCNNTSGVPGVDWLTRRGRWRASICFKGRRYSLGSYGRFEDAVRARRRAEETLHDEFVREFDKSAAERQKNGGYGEERWCVHTIYPFDARNGTGQAGDSDCVQQGKRTPGRALCVGAPRDERLEDLELECTLYVKTLGGFSLRYSHSASSEIELSERDGGSWRQQAFLQYLCVNHQRRVPQEEMIDVLWDDGEVSNPANTLKTLLHRTRLTLERLGFADGKKTLLCRRGNYTWDPELNIQLDVEEFDTLRAKFDAAPGTEEGLEAAKQALALYGGDFLPQAAASIWALSPRTYYHSKYLRLCCGVANGLWELERLPEAVEVCQLATALDPYDENCQMLMMRLLYASGARQAVAQYFNDVSALLMNQLGVSPSAEMTALYHELNAPEQAQELDLRAIRTIVLGEDAAGKGAFFCEYYVFQNICRLLARTTARSGQVLQLGVITVFPRRGNQLAMAQRTAAMSDLKQVTLANLRSGDIFTQFSLTQYLLLLPTASHENGSMAVNRVLEAFGKCKSSTAAVPRFSLLPALSAERRLPAAVGFRPMGTRKL